MNLRKTITTSKHFHRAWMGVVIGTFVCSLALVGCSNGSGGTKTDRGEMASNIHIGVFTDSPVEGLAYTTETQSGITDESGAFTYMDGEMVEFHLGGLTLGEGPARPIMTPIDLVEGAMDETDPAVTNICRLLQTLDADENPENGIMIPEEIADMMISESINFMMDEYDFAHQDGIVNLMDSLMNVPGFEHGRMMVSGDSAQEHMRGTMMDMGLMDEDGDFMDRDNRMTTGNDMWDHMEANSMHSGYGSDSDFFDHM